MGTVIYSQLSAVPAPSGSLEPWGSHSSSVPSGIALGCPSPELKVFVSPCAPFVTPCPRSWVRKSVSAGTFQGEATSWSGASQGRDQAPSWIAQLPPNTSGFCHPCVPEAQVSKSLWCLQPLRQRMQRTKPNPLYLRYRGSEILFHKRFCTINSKISNC